MKVEDLNKLVDERLAGDRDFQSRIANLSDAEKETETAKRRTEIIAEEMGKREEVGGNQKTRAERAETELETLRKDPRLTPKPEEKEQTLSYAEMIELQSAKVHPDFEAEVRRMAKTLNKPIIEALKDPTVIGQIDLDNQKRESANVVDTTGQRPGGGAETDKEVLDNARGKNGQRVIPAAGTPQAGQLFRARRQEKFKALESRR